MGIEPYLLSSSILGVLAQRLVRQICPHCKMAYNPSPDELHELNLHEPFIFYKGKGCAHCFETGYKGRHGIYELMMVTPRIKEQVLRSQDAQELRRVAIAEGMTTLFKQGVQLVLRGITTSSELLRATRIDQNGD
jgi:general secretion pathway protein E